MIFLSLDMYNNILYIPIPCALCAFGIFINVQTVTLLSTICDVCLMQHALFARVDSLAIN